MCNKILESIKVEFWIAWKGVGPMTLSDEDCRLRLKDEICGCEAGGESKISEWYFRYECILRLTCLHTDSVRSDPNRGFSPGT